MGFSVTTINRGVDLRRHASNTRIHSGEVGSILPTPHHNCFSSLSGLGYDMRPQVTTINRGVELRHYASNTRIHSGDYEIMIDRLPLAISGLLQVLRGELALANVRANK